MIFGVRSRYGQGWKVRLCLELVKWLAPIKGTEQLLMRLLRIANPAL